MKKLTALTLAGILILVVSGSAMARMGGRGHMGEYRGMPQDEQFGLRTMGYGQGQGPGYCWDLSGEEDRITSADGARAEVEEFLSFRRNPNVKAGEVADKGSGYEVEIVTQDGSLADKALVDKKTGRIMPVYR